MSTETPTPTENCPYCGSEKDRDFFPSNSWQSRYFRCQTHIDLADGKTVSQTNECRLRIELTQARERIAELEKELESHAWEISPAMAQARIEQLFAENERLKAELVALKATPAPLERPSGPVKSGEYPIPTELWVQFRTDGTRGIKDLWDFNPWQAESIPVCGMAHRYVLTAPATPPAPIREGDK